MVEYHIGLGALVQMLGVPARIGAIKVGSDLKGRVIALKTNIQTLEGFLSLGVWGGSHKSLRRGGGGDRSKTDISLNVGRGYFSATGRQRTRKSAQPFTQPGPESRACLQRLCVQW